MPDDDLDRLQRAAAGLTIRPRVDRWTHLPLCVLNAVFSIGAKYSGVVAVCHRYATFAGLADPLLPVAEAHRVIGTDREQPVDLLAKHGTKLGPTGLAAQNVLRNRGRTSTRSGILKAEAAARYAEILAGEGVHRLADVSALLSQPECLAAVENRLRTVPGNGTGDVRLGYLWMTAGDDQHVKPDRMILRWLAGPLRRQVSAVDARRLLAEVAARLGCTPWELDRAIWRRQSGAD